MPKIKKFRIGGAKAKRASAKLYERRRGSSAKRGYGYRWQRYREAYLQDHPLCVECLKEDVVTSATDVDHIDPAAGPDDPKFWDPDNHQSLCHSHHSSKTASEDGGFGRQGG